MTCLHDEYEPLRAQLLARHPFVSLMDALADVRNEEACLLLLGYYRKKKAHRSQVRQASQVSQASGSASAGMSQRSSTDPVAQEMLMLLRRLAASSLSGTASVVTLPAGSPGSAAASQSSTQGPPGTNAWILDSGASFHMTPHHTFLSSMHSPSRSLTVHTANVSSFYC